MLQIVGAAKTVKIDSLKGTRNVLPAGQNQGATRVDVWQPGENRSQVTWGLGSQDRLQVSPACAERYKLRPESSIPLIGQLSGVRPATTRQARVVRISTLVRMELDHVLIEVTDLAAAARELEASCGLRTRATVHC